MAEVLVTGGTGYIGSHTVVELQKEGYEVIIIDDLSNSYISVLDNIEKISGKRPVFYEIDLREKEKVTSVFEQHKFESIIHFAAKKAVGESVEKPLMYYDININSLLILLSHMDQFKVKDIVFSSSCTVYGQPDKLPVTETSPFIAAESPYGNTKQVCEEILRDNAKVNEHINAISLRYFNPVGAHESALIGELPTGVPNNLVPFITQTAAGIRKQLNVFGGDYDTRDGTAVRDYIHVVDLAKAHVLALKRLETAKHKDNYEYFNIGTGNGSTVLEVIEAFESSTGQKLNYKISSRRPGDVEKIYADTTLANDDLGWKAVFGLEEMMSSAWRWQQRISNDS